jgi:hypothetical protein
VAKCSPTELYKPTGQPMIEAWYDTMTMVNLSHFLEDPVEEYHKFDYALLTLATRWNIAPYSSMTNKHTSPKPSPFPPSISTADILKSVVLSALRRCVNRVLVRTEQDYI